MKYLLFISLFPIVFSVECHVCSGADSTTGRLKANLRNAMFAKRIPNPKGSGNCNSKASTSTCTGEVCVKDVVTYKFKYRFSIYYFHTYTKYCGKNTTAQLPNSCVQTGNQAVTEDYVAIPNRCICNDKQYCNGLSQKFSHFFLFFMYFVVFFAF